MQSTQAARAHLPTWTKKTARTIFERRINTLPPILAWRAAALVYIFVAQFCRPAIDADTNKCIPANSSINSRLLAGGTILTGRAHTLIVIFLAIDTTITINTLAIVDPICEPGAELVPFALIPFVFTLILIPCVKLLEVNNNLTSLRLTSTSSTDNDFTIEVHIRKDHLQLFLSSICNSQVQC
jgi:hypothetical protein